MQLITDKRKNNGLVNPDFEKFLKNKIQLSTFTQQESDDLKQILIEGLKNKPAIGISANQLGINKRACVIVNSLDICFCSKDNESDYLFLLNPVIINKSNDFFIFQESCPSLHNTLEKSIRTYRHTEVVISTDNLGEIKFKIDPEKDSQSTHQWKVSLETLQTAAVQHEIDHLDGITIKERNTSNFNQKKVSYNRNDKIIMKAPSGEFFEVKFKKANEYFLKGYEIV